MGQKARADGVTFADVEQAFGASAIGDPGLDAVLDGILYGREF